MLDFLINILKWKNLIIIFTFVGAVASVVIALVLPLQYITMASVRGAGGGESFNISSLMKSTGGGMNLGSLLDVAVPGRSGETDYYIAILKSRTVLDSMIYRFDLIDRYEVKKIEDARDKLKSNTELNRDNPAEIVFIGVHDKEPEIAFKMTSYYVELLNSIYSRLTSEAARNTRIHLEERYLETLKELTLVEDSLRIFQEKFGVYDIYLQTEAAIKSASTLKTNLILKEVEYQIKKINLGENSPEVNIIKKEIEELNKNYNKLITGNNYSTSTDIFIPFKNTPELGLRYFRLYRDVQIYNELIKVLIPLLEQSKIQELRETPSLLVIDHPVVPSKKSKPKRMIIVLLGTSFFFFVGFLYAFIRENLNNVREKDPERYSKIQAIYKSLFRFK